MQNMQATTNSIIGRIIDLISVTSRAVRYASFRLLRSSSSSNNVLLTISEFVLDSKILLEYKNLVQKYTHKLQHPNIATYSEITTFSRNQTKLQVFFKLQLLRSCNVLLSTDVL